MTTTIETSETTELQPLPVSFGGETWPLFLQQGSKEFLVRDLDVAAWLGYERPHDIRELINRHGPALGEVFRTVRKTSEAGGRPGMDNYLTERQVLILIAKSETAPEEKKSRGFAVFGTPEYMAPEQVDGSAEVTAAADLYALGVTLFEMLTGKLPFSAATPMLTAMQRLFHDAPDPRSVQPDLHPQLAELVLRCLRRNPKERIGSAQELAASLSQFLPSRAMQARRFQSIRRRCNSILASQTSELT